jgi:hypothetical protein
MARPKKYKIDEEYFNSNISERESYLLGLILSDGHLNYKKGMFGYICSVKDIEIIKFIKKELKSTHPIKKVISNGTEYARYSITNKAIVQSVINKYSLPHSNKSQNNIDIPNNLPTICISHFLRGFFDGDGSIWFDGKTYRASFTGGEKMMKSIRIVLSDLKIPSYISYRYSIKNKNSCNLVINGTFNVDKFGEFLYKNSFCCLERKYKKFKSCSCKAEYSRKRLFSLNGNEEKIQQLYNSGVSQIQISRELALVESSVKGCVQRLRRKNKII